MGTNRLVAALASAALTLVFAGGCAATAESSDSTPATTASASKCPDKPHRPVSADEAASCVYRAWVSGDDNVVLAYGGPGVTDPLPTVMADPQMTSDGCSAPAGVDEAIVCTWSGDFQDGPVAIHMQATGNASDGYRVTKIDVEH